MSASELKQQLKKAKLSNQILLGVAGLFLIGNIVLGVQSFQNKAKKEVIVPELNIDTASYAIINDDLEENLAVYQLTQQLDSFKIVVDTLSNQLERADIKITKNQALASVSQDYIGELIEYAKEFNQSDCNKSLAFLYAAKKIASTDGTTEVNKIALSNMINSCEANLFGDSNNSEKAPDNGSSLSVNK